MGADSGLARERYEIEFEDAFGGDALDERRWLPHHLPQWSSRELSAARYELGNGCLSLRIEPGQGPWCPEFDGQVRVSSLQTGVFAGPLGSRVGQHRFNDAAVVREEQATSRLYTPRFGLVEMRCRATLDQGSMAALWMIGFEETPEQSAEICICEIFGKDAGPEGARVGMGVHPFGDPAIADEFAAETLPIDVRDFHTYAAEWTPERVAFFVDDRLVKTVEQAPAYPMQLMLGIYDFAGESPAASEPGRAPVELVVDYVRGYRRRPDGAV